MSLNPQLLQSAVDKGKTKWLREYLSQKLPLLSLPSANYQAWFDDFIQILESKNLVQPSQQKNPLTDVRNAIKVLDPNHPALEVIQFSRDTWVQINDSDRDRIAQRTTKLIRDPDAIVNQAIELVKTNNWSDIAAGLAVLTGRRCAEVLKTAVFEAKSKYSLTFKGSLKRRNEAVELVFAIPILCRADLAIQAVDTLRLQLGDEVQHLSVRQINQRYEERVAKKCDRHFAHLVPKRDGKDNLYTHLFKAVYSTIACHWYCPVSVPKMEYASAIQGHYKLLDNPNGKLRRSIASNRNYDDYEIADGSGNIDGRLGIKLCLPGVEVIDQFQLKVYQSPTSEVIEIQSRHSSSQSKSKLVPVRQQHHSSKLMPSINNKSSNSSNQALVSLQVPLSRLENIAHLLDLSNTEAMASLLDWAEAGVSLAHHFQIEHPTAEALTNHVIKLEQDYASTASYPSSESPRPQPGFQSDRASVDEHQRLILSVSSLSNSVELLTEALLEGKKRSVEQIASQQPQPQATSKESVTALPEVASSVKSSDLSANNSPAEQENSTTKSRRRSPADNRERDTHEVMTEDINRAINAVMQFNDAPNRPHKQKFRLSISPLSDLTVRAFNSISKVLKERKKEIDAHHRKHQLSTYHNKSRKDENGHEYPSIESEPQILYHKLTHVDTPDTSE